MKNLIKSILLLLLTCNIFFYAKVAFSNDTNKYNEKNIQINLNINKETAIKIAELILVKIYGKDVLKQRPWNVSLKGNTYNITGTFHEKDADGGVAEIKISKLDGRILEYLHWK